MSNILNMTDIVKSVKTIEKDCECEEGKSGKLKEPDYEKFYNRIKGLMVLVEENIT